MKRLFREMSEKMSIVSKSKLYLGINISKQVKTLYNGNFEILKRLKKIIECGKAFYDHGLAEIIL